MALTKESEEFIANLRMYLLTSGKNDEEINAIADELRSHLEDAESRGKKTRSVTGDSPEAYMESIRSEMATDFFGLAKLMPMFILLMLAYFLTGPAIRGELSFSILTLITYPLVAFLGIGAYVFFFRKMSVRKWSAKREIAVFMGIQFTVVLLFAAMMFLDIFLFEPFYIPSRDMAWAIAAAGITVFIVSALWNKTWITVVLPLFLFGPDFVMQFIEVGQARQLIISTSVLYAGLALIIAFLFIQNKKQNPHKL